MHFIHAGKMCVNGEPALLQGGGDCCTPSALTTSKQALNMCSLIPVEDTHPLLICVNQPKSSQIVNMKEKKLADVLNHTAWWSRIIHGAQG